MTFDAHANFAYGTVLTAPSPPTSGTSLTLQSGQGALMPTPPFNATCWPAGAQPLSSNAEIVRVTAISTDTLTVEREQEGTTAQSIAAGWQFAAGVTVKTITDVQSATLVPGDIIPSAAFARSGCLMCTGAVVSRTTYSELLAAISGTEAAASFTASSQTVGVTAGTIIFLETLTGLGTGSHTGLSIHASATVSGSTYTGQITGYSSAASTVTVNFTPSATATAALLIAPYGIGDGSTTFNVPDLRGRSPLGAGTGTAAGATAWTLGQQPASGAGGEQTHTLTSAESGLPAHSHSINDNGHSHGPGNLNSHFGEMNVSQGTQSTATVVSGQSLGDAYPAVTGGATAGAYTGISINNNAAANASSAHNNMSPVSVVNWFIVY